MVVVPFLKLSCLWNGLLLLNFYCDDLGPCLKYHNAKKKKKRVHSGYQTSEMSLCWCVESTAQNKFQKAGTIYFFNWKHKHVNMKTKHFSLSLYVSLSMICAFMLHSVLSQREHRYEKKNYQIKKKPLLPQHEW